MKSLFDEIERRSRASSFKSAPGPKKKYAEELKSIEELKHEAQVEIWQAQATNREKIHDDLIALHKSLARYDNPYISLEIALRIIQTLVGDRTLAAGYEEKIEVVRARAFQDENAKLYRRDKIDTRIEQVENSDLDEIEKAKVLWNLRRTKDDLD